MKVCFYVYIKYVKIPFLPYQLASKISQDCKYTFYFDDCLKALDGIHISIYILKCKCCPYWNRKKWLLQNILADYNFNIRFQFILSDWKRSAHDNKIFKNVINRKIFVILDRKNCLVNARYSNSNHLFMPYKGVYNNLKDQYLAQQHS